MNSIKSIGIIGHGKFGKLLESLLEKIFSSVQIKIYSRNETIDSKKFFILDEVIKSDLIIPAVPIESFEEIIKTIAKDINLEAIVMDVCSVKEYPVKVMKDNLPVGVTIIASHPLFGPGTIEKLGSFDNLKVVMSFVSGNKNKFKEIKSAFMNHLEVIEMNPEDHDKVMAKSQFIAHLTAGVLNNLSFSESVADTKSVVILHEFMAMIHPDPMLLKDIFQYNSHCMVELEQFKNANKSVIELLNQ